MKYVKKITSSESGLNSGIILRYLILYTLSGFVVVSMETVWIRSLSLIIGNTVAAATAAICVFFVFAAFGNLIGGSLARKRKNPAFLYGIAEIGFAVTALLLYPLASLLPLSHAVGGISALFNYIISAVILVAVPSLFAGISLPLLLQAFVWRSDTRTSTGGLLYGGNLIGAASGVISGGIILPMFFGFTNTVVIISSLGICEGLLAILWNKKVLINVESVKTVINKKTDISSPEISNAGGYMLLALSGCLGLGIELLMMQYFRQLEIGSVYSVSAVLFSFLIGISAGSFVASFARKTKYDIRQLLSFFLLVAAIMCAFYSNLFQNILHHAASGYDLTGRQDLTLAGYALRTVIRTMLIMLPLLTCTGTIFPLAWEIIEKGATSQGAFFGKAVFVNKLGCALGSVLFPFAVVPLLGMNAALLATGLLFLISVFCLDIRFFSVLKNNVLGMIFRIASVLIIIMFFYKMQTPVHLNPGDHLLGLYQGAGSTTAVIEDENKSRHIVLNQHYILNGTQKALLSQQQESWIPLFLCDKPKNVAFIGVASGISANAALDFPITKLDAIEIVPDVAKAANKWFGQWNKSLFDDKRSTVIIEDGRRVIAAAKHHYDCVICDLVLPGGEATNDLYSQDFFNMVKNKLDKNGIFCLWLPMYQMDHELAGIVIKTFSSVFSDAIIVRGNFDPLQNTIGLIGSPSQIDISSEVIQKRMDSIPASSAIRQSVFFKSACNFYLTMVGDLASMKYNMLGLPVTTDNRPVFAFLGPRPIPNGKFLRALTYLNWTNAMVPPSDFPSCITDTTDIRLLQAGCRAGNYYYAAAISHLALPVSKEKQSQRYLQYLNYQKIAKEISPESEVEIDKE